MGTKIKHIQGYDLYNNYTAIVDKGDIPKQRLSQQAKILKANFLMGPCRANGIIVNVEIPDLQNQAKQDDSKGADNKAATNKSTDNKTDAKGDAQQSQSVNPSTGKPNEKYNYSIFESYMAYSNYVFNEDSMFSVEIECFKPICAFSLHIVFSLQTVCFFSNNITW